MGAARRDDLTGVFAAVGDPPGWLTVSVQQLGPSGGSFGTFDFQGWSTFRQWVELSDPDFRAAMLTPSQIATAPIPL
jgi:hypothetical protein